MEKLERKRKPKPSSINKKNSFLKKSAKLSAQQTISRKRVTSSLKNSAEPEKMKMGKQSASHGILKRPKEVSLQEKSKSVDPSGFASNFVPVDRYGMSGSGEKMDKKTSSPKHLQKKVSYAKPENDYPDQLIEKDHTEIKGGGEDGSRVRYQETQKSKRWIRADLERIEHSSRKTSQHSTRSRKREKREDIAKRRVKTKSKSKERDSASLSAPSKTRLRKPSEYMSTKSMSRSSNETVPSRKARSFTTRESSISTHRLSPLPSRNIDQANSYDYVTSRTSSRKAVHSGMSINSEFTSDTSMSDTHHQETKSATQSKPTSKSSLGVLGRRSSWIPPRSVASALRQEATQRPVTDRPPMKIKPRAPRMSLREFYDDVATQRSFISPRAPSTIGNFPPESIGDNTSLHGTSDTQGKGCSCKNVPIGSKSVTSSNVTTTKKRGIKNMRRSADGKDSPKKVHSREETESKSGSRPFVYNREGRVSLSPSFTYFSTIHTTHKKCRLHNAYTGPLRYQFRFRSPRPCLCRAHPSRRERHRELHSMTQAEQEKRSQNPERPTVAQRYSHTFQFKKPLTQESGQASNYFFIGTESLMAPDRYRGPRAQLPMGRFPGYPSGYMEPNDTETIWSRTREESPLRSVKVYSRSSNESVAGSTEVASTDDPDSDVPDIRDYDIGQSIYGLRGSAMKWLDEAGQK